MGFPNSMTPYITKKTDRVKRSHYRDMIWFGAPAMVIVVGLVFGWIPQHFLAYLLPIAGLLLSFAFYRQWKRFLRFDCPTCGKPLPASELNYEHR